MITNRNFIFNRIKFARKYKFNFTADEKFCIDNDGSAIYLICQSDPTWVREIVWTEDTFFFRDLKASKPFPTEDEVLNIEDPVWIQALGWIPFESDYALEFLLNQIFNVILDEVS